LTGPAAAQVYVDKSSIDDDLIAKITASAQHPHAIDAAVSMMMSPRGARELSVMVRDACARGTPVAMIHGACAPHPCHARCAHAHVRLCCLPAFRSIAADTKLGYLRTHIAPASPGADAEQ
jgi:hypothetical protein